MLDMICIRLLDRLMFAGIAWSGGPELALVQMSLAEQQYQAELAVPPETINAVAGLVSDRIITW